MFRRAIGSAVAGHAEVSRCSKRLLPTSLPFTTASISSRRSFSSARTAFNNNMANEDMHNLQALMGRLDDMRAAHQQPQDISSRTPNTISTSNNSADKIERHLRADGHKIWGFVVYRSTYADNSAWSRGMQRFHEVIRKNMDLYNGHDLLQEDRFQLTVIEDAGSFDGASTQVLREHFREWCTRMLPQEQGSQEEIEGRRQDSLPFDYLMPTRYNYFLQIDEASLRSVLAGGKEGWVKVIKGDWTQQDKNAQEDNEDQDEFDEEEDEEYPEIEGCTDEDVGWMKVPVRDVIPDLYADLRDPNHWNIVYCRPPDVSSPIS